MRQIDLIGAEQIRRDLQLPAAGRQALSTMADPRFFTVAGPFTVAELAKVIEVHLIEQAGADRYAGILAEIEGLSDEEVRALLDRETEVAESDGGR